MERHDKDDSITDFIIPAYPKKAMPIDEETLWRLDRYGNTVISPTKFRYYDNDTKKVEKRLKELGYENVRCRISRLRLPTFKGYEGIKKTIIIEGKKRK